ncbi:hypothetical protein AEST_06340 [Alishewanella aestuarii B11]|uniref:Uncharacterized protein n=1 Tax=Alishewanella aestuarii B11 TaxID=1197174 RepID=J1Q5B8_9ALTE|nr:hypothetical protein AEST_06340 [Alishewanella aestuarii B11]
MISNKFDHLVHRAKFLLVEIKNSAEYTDFIENRQLKNRSAG